MRHLLISLFICTLFNSLHAQKGVTAFGIQFKPIFPLNIVNTDGKVVRDDETGSTLTIDVNSGYSMGATIRFGLTDRISIETGINYIVRNYSFELTNNSFSPSSAELKFPGYQLPLVGMVFVRLSENVYMNSSAGISFDMFPTQGVVSHDRDSIEYGLLEKNWVMLSLVANLGFEYRSKKSGYFYLGASYHNTFGDMADVIVSYKELNSNQYVKLVDPYPAVNGNYLSLDLRYYFNPEPRKKSVDAPE